MRRPVIKIPTVIIKALARAGFVNIYTPMIFGDPDRLHLHDTVVPMNTLFNLSSGEIFVGEDSFFGHNCMVLTGQHFRTQAEKMKNNVRKTGYDIHIGKRCWIASGAIVLSNVTIGDDSTIAAGSIITKDVPEGSVIKGIY
jgi:acetyltransferase-like isoleucine patch superfamily enzyme